DVFASKKATLSGNSELKALRAKTDPVRGSASVTTCMVDFGRVSPSTHSTYPVADSRRLRPDLLLTFRTENFTAASGATYTCSSELTPSSVCSNMLYPNPCRVI